MQERDDIMKLVTKFVCKFFKTDDIIRYVINLIQNLIMKNLICLLKKYAVLIIPFIYLFTYVIKNLSLENRNTLKKCYTKFE